MQILNSDDSAISVVHLRAIKADLKVLGASEVASYWFGLPKPPTPVEWPGFKLYVASDLGLFTYEASPGWGEPHVAAGGIAAEAWKLDGAFRPWSQFEDLAVSLSTAWDDQLGARRPRRAISATHPAIDISEPRAGWNVAGSDQGAWEAFVRACIKLTACLNASEPS
jgi:hypothetical protein